MYNTQVIYFKFKLFFETFPIKHVGAECEGSVNDDDNHDSTPSNFVLKKKIISLYTIFELVKITYV